MSLSCLNTVHIVQGGAKHTNQEVKGKTTNIQMVVCVKKKMGEPTANGGAHMSRYTTGYGKNVNCFLG